MDAIRDSKGNQIQCQQLPVLDPFQEIDPIESYVCFEEHQRYLSADREYENVSLRRIA